MKEISLEEAIKNVKEFNKQNRFRDCGVLNQSIDTVLKELDRRIPPEKIHRAITIIIKKYVGELNRNNVYNEMLASLLELLLDLSNDLLDKE